VVKGFCHMREGVDVANILDMHYFIIKNINIIYVYKIIKYIEKKFLSPRLTATQILCDIVVWPILNQKYNIAIIVSAEKLFIIL